jgi:hypothetical protein
VRQRDAAVAASEAAKTDARVLRQAVQQTASMVRNPNLTLAQTLSLTLTL